MSEDLYAKTLLLVDDEEFFFSLLEVMLRDTGVNIIYAESGEAALKVMTDRQVDIVLLDIRLPDLSGFEIFEKIRRLKSHIPVVAHTANCIPEEKEKFLAAGFAGYLEKPIDSDTIRQLLIDLIGKAN